MKKASGFLRKLDLFAVRVQLSYKGERSFNTAFGGFCSLFLVISFLAFALYELHSELNDKVLSNSQFSSFVPLLSDFVVPTQNSTMAVEITNGDTDPQDQISQYLRVTFNNNNVQIPARFCTDLFAKEIAEEQESGVTGGFFASYLVGNFFICPDVTMMTLNNRDSFNMEILPCQTAQQSDIDAGITSYADLDGMQTCADYQDVQNYINGGYVNIQSYFMSTYFDPAQLEADQQMPRMRQLYREQQLNSQNTELDLTNQNIQVYANLVLNQLYDNFWWPSQSTTLSNHSFEFGYINNILRWEDDLPFFSIKLNQGQNLTSTRWKRSNFKAYLAYIYTLFFSTMAAATLLISGYQRFVSDKSMLKKLYGETRQDPHGLQQTNQDEEKEQLEDEMTPKVRFREKLELRQEFRVRYCCFTLISVFKALCCCLVPCCSRTQGRFRRQLDSHTKFLLAQKHLQQEQDIQYLIKMNRVSRLLHKARFLPRQRKILDYFHRYVISAEDIENVEKQKEKDEDLSQSIKMFDLLDNLMDGFDPENDLTDRRIYYEVTGQSLIPDEFIYDDSSDNADMFEEIDPYDWLTARKVEGQVDEQQQLLQTKTIN